MSQREQEIDLEAFARKKEVTIPAPKGRWKRYALPVVLVGAFAAILVYNFGEAFRDAVPVRLVRPRQATGGSAQGSAAFQAAGWVEPDPFALEVLPLTQGTVAEVLVQESDQVQEGDVVARLVADDAKLALQSAEATLVLAQRQAERARVDQRYAKEDFDAAIALQEKVAVAKAEHAGHVAESRRLGEAALRTRADVRVAEEELTVQKHLAENKAAGPRQVELAEARLESARAAQATAEAAHEYAKARIEVAQAHLQAALTDQKLRILDRQKLALADNAVELRDAELEIAKVRLAEARLRHERITVRSPWSGIVLQRLAVPGQATGGSGDRAICSLYDPRKLRIRVDVPQEEVAKAEVGQLAAILSESRRGKPYHGRVVRLVSQADIQKVTLQVHVEVLDPDELLRPEMLCQVRFEAGRSKTTSSGTAPAGIGAAGVLMIPRRLLVDGDSCWVLHSDGKTGQLRKLELGDSRGDEVAVRSGLNLTDKILDLGGRNYSAGQPIEVVPGEAR